MELLFKNIERHIKITDKEKLFVSSLFVEKRFPKKAYLLQAGETCKYETFVLEGVIRTYTIDELGNEHILMFGIEDWWVGDLLSFLTGKPSIVFIEVLENAKVLQISKEKLESLYQTLPQFERYFRLLIQNAFVYQVERINQNLSLTAEERYFEFLKKYPNLDQRITQKHLASYLGITPVFLSMLRKRFASKKN